MFNPYDSKYKLNYFLIISSSAFHRHKRFYIYCKNPFKIK
ncbi:hypothetical protein HMP0721_0668 [Pseudoramibacter alactolyticus ATCC 23263]|uniref:Uncharacterized protein n=1 Tax=Pseudoramibacter alactolyticus ATCC 23263 TaxID=887929 RepID=E6MF85_9FIRM|nr:hypothetical protein HMP0721_0668 [Pseudoramibacter alactolyticus ATCC 23263]